MKSHRPKYSLAYIKALQLYTATVGKSTIKNSTNVLAGYSGITVNAGNRETYSPEDITITDSTILSQLSHRALLLCIRIISELKFNNALWHFDHTKNSRDRTAIKELRSKAILFPTEETHIHFVNPDLIRKGNKVLVLGNTAVITATGRVELSMIRPLNKKNIELNPLHLTELT